MKRHFALLLALQVTMVGQPSAASGNEPHRVYSEARHLPGSGSPITVFDQGAGDLSALINVIGFNQTNSLYGGRFANATASFFFDNIFRRAHTLHLGGPNWLPSYPVPTLELESAGQFGLVALTSPNTVSQITLTGDFQYDPSFFFRPRGTIDGYVYFPEAGGAVDITFGMSKGEEVFPPFYSARITNDIGAGALFPFGGTGRIALGTVQPVASVTAFLSATSIDGGPFTVFLPNSLHVSFVPEPSAAILMGFGGATIGFICRRRRRFRLPKALQSSSTHAFPALRCAFSSSAKLACLFAAVWPVLVAPASAQDHQVFYYPTVGFSAINIIDQESEDLDQQPSIVGFASETASIESNGTNFANATAQFFKDSVFFRLHSLSLSGPAYLPSHPAPDPRLNDAGYFGRRADSPCQILCSSSIELAGSFAFNQDFFFRPRGTIAGYVYFPEPGGEVDLFFGIRATPPSSIANNAEGFQPPPLPFYQETIVNPSATSGALVPFSGSGTAVLGPIVESTIILTAASSGSYTVYLPNSLHVGFDPPAVPEPSTALLLVASGAIIAGIHRRRRMISGGPLPSPTAYALWAALLLSLPLSTATSAAIIRTAPVGNPGNASDSTGFGAVGNAFRIARFEVTNDQYAEFLNAKAASDPRSLYSTNMGSDLRGGITRSGVSGSFTYATKPNMGDKPVNFVNWYDAVRFANWLHNGQGSGDTETGAYTLLGGGATPSNGPSVTRNPDAIWFLPSEHEWYKAAYHDSRTAAEGGPPGDDHYWLYPTARDAPPIQATANSAGDISNPGANVANSNQSADWNGLDGNVTTVGSAGPLSASFYGTSDQGGNVWEWLESPPGSTSRRIRGGSWQDLRPNLAATIAQSFSAATGGTTDLGFRVASAVPEPAAMALAALGLAALAIANKRSGRRENRDATPVCATSTFLMNRRNKQ